jgi:DUF4097 and DUF4098 domain-containing protein YvlB
MAYTSVPWDAPIEDAVPGAPPPAGPLLPEPPSAMRPRHRGRWLAAAWLCAIAVIAPTASKAYKTLIQQSTTSTWSATHAITAVTVDMSNGDVGLSAGAADAAAMTENLTWDVSKPVVTESWTGTTLNVSERCSDHGALAADNCSASLMITIPAATQVTVTSQSGEVDVNGINGAVHVRTGSGDINLEGISGTLWAHAISGAVSGNSISSSTADVGTGSGDIFVQFGAVPDQVVSSAISGQTTILVPPGSGGYLITGRTNSGQRDIDGSLENDTSSHTISADSGSGDVQIQSEP